MCSNSRENSAVIAKQNFFQYWQDDGFVQLNLLRGTGEDFVIGECLNSCRWKATLLDADFTTISIDINDVASTLRLLLAT